MELIKPNNPAPFWGFIGSFEKIEEADLMIRYNEFYDTFLRKFDLNSATDKLHEANPSIPSSYRFINSELTFKNVIRHYFENKFTDEEVAKRFKDMLHQEGVKISDRNEKQKFRTQFKIKLLKTRKKYFDKHKRTFFMTDVFPENEKRFQVTYEELNNAS